jgi:hypothetical protein
MYILRASSVECDGQLEVCVHACKRGVPARTSMLFSFTCSVQELVTILDNFELASTNVKTETEKEASIKGSYEVSFTHMIPLTMRMCVHMCVCVCVHSHFHTWRCTKTGQHV